MPHQACGIVEEVVLSKVFIRLEIQQYVLLPARLKPLSPGITPHHQATLTHIPGYLGNTHTGTCRTQTHFSHRTTTR